MSRGQYQPVSLVWLVIVAVMVVFFVYQIANAQHKCQGGHNCNDGETASAVVSSGRSIGVGGADYDIGRGSCKFHVGGLTVAIAQTDEFCEGMEMIRAGLVEAGILHLCLQSEVGKNYKTLEDCQSSLEIVTTTNLIPIETELVVKDDEDEYRQAQQTYLGELESRMDKLDSQRQASARRYAEEKQKDQQAAQKVLDAYEGVQQ